jgi:ferredoxin
MARVRITNRTDAEGLPVEIESSPAVSILNALLVAGIRIRHDCGGKALCGTCALRVLEGAAGVSPIGPLEAERLAGALRPAGFRLACQTKAARDIDIEVVLD